MACDTGTYAEEDAAALRSRRQGLRALSEDLADCVIARPLPETWLEANRAVRAITASDRFLQRVPPAEPDDEDADEDADAEDEDDEEYEYEYEYEYEDEDEDEDAPVPAQHDPCRMKLRARADEVLDAAAGIKKPDSFLEDERAARYMLNADRMLVQLYTTPKPRAPGRFTDDDDDDAFDDDGPEVLTPEMKRIMAALVDYTGRYARRYGFRLDGSTCDRDSPEAHACEDTPDSPDEPPEHFDNILANTIVRCINTLANHYAGHHGHWPDGSPFTPSDPTFLYVSANFGGDVRRPAPDEIREGCVWWIVRKRRDGEAGPEPPP